MNLHYSQTWLRCQRSCRKFHYLMNLHYSQTNLIGDTLNALFHYLMNLHYSQTDLKYIYAITKFHYLMNLHYSQTWCWHGTPHYRFTTLWIYTILKQEHRRLANSYCFTTLWIYTILKPQISCAHYTAQGKSTRSSTIVLWRNGIVKGAQIPIQHIEFGAHIYARRCLAL